MEALILLGILVAISLIAMVLGIRDEKAREKALLEKLKKNFGQAPKREYKNDELDHIPGYFKAHKEDFQLDDTTWNDFNMDGVFARSNYCLSTAGEEYLYYLLRTPKLSDDFDDMEKKVTFFQNNDEQRRKLQLIFSKIGRNIRYSIYDYIDYLDGAKGFSNKGHYFMLLMMLLAVIGCFFSFTTFFITLIGLALVNIVRYFQVKNEIESYLSSYRYIMKVINCVEYFEKLDIPEISDDIERLKKAAVNLKGFKKGSYILMSSSRMNSGGNPAEMLLDYIRIITHADLIKFNQMYKEIMKHKDELDEILTVTGKLEAYISIACFRESFKDSYCIPEFKGDSIHVKELFHPLIENAVPNDIDTDRGVLITGSNASGKSTFLKALGINQILAQSFHTALSLEYVSPIYRVFSSMALSDNIFEGDSYYIVEIKSIKRILDAANEGTSRVLCFVDEVLRGTNTIERIAASTQILKSFSDNKVMCFAATHDIELTALLGEEYKLHHFEGNVSDNDVHFDYIIKDGPATNRNAIKLLGVLGYDKQIVTRAQDMADRFLSTGIWS